ncbi:MAG: hypothetical protein H6581_14705 [Bacteroidia bacterium]|nr:hypothetical protein [Bacteroidia bacterium]
MNIKELIAVNKAFHYLKFESPPSDAILFALSPHFNSAFLSFFQEIKEYQPDSPSTFDLSERPDLIERISNLIGLIPSWKKYNVEEKTEFISQLSIPYSINENVLKVFLEGQA